MISPRPSLASQRWVQHGPSEPLTFSHSRVLSVKRGDGEYLSREDVQYDFLSAIFSSTVKAFTNQAPNTPKDSPKITFAELYIGSIVNSSKCSKSQRENLAQNPDFAIDYCKVCLLVNVGRINTTFAFYPEMKTQLRTYHPIPCFQRSAIAKKCMQDSPRMKSTMKGCLLVHERRNIPLAPQELLLKSFNHTPTTSIVNLLFILAGHSASISRTHFEGLEFLDLFLPINIPSEARSRAFLWVIYYYLENPKENPFDDDFSRANPGRVPLLPRFTTPEDMAAENVDTQEELEWGTKMGQWRKQYQQTMAQQAAVEDWTEPPPPAIPRTTRTTPPESAARMPSSNPPAPSSAQMNISHQKQRGGSYARIPQAPSFASGRHFSLLHRAVVIGSAVDPLFDSDEEDGDETRMDLERRWTVLQTYCSPS